MIDLSKIKSCLAVVAHPDDEVLGVGGTLKKLSKQGIRVYVLYLTDGRSGRVHSSKIDEEELAPEVKQLKKEVARASKVLGLDGYKILSFPDNRFDTVSRMDISLEISKYSQEVKPDIAFIHHEGDYNW